MCGAQGCSVSKFRYGWALINEIKYAIQSRRPTSIHTHKTVDSDEKYNFLVDTVSQTMEAEQRGQIDPTFYDLGISLAESILTESRDPFHCEYASSTLAALQDSKDKAINRLIDKGRADMAAMQADDQVFDSDLSSFEFDRKTAARSAGAAAEAIKGGAAAIS